MAAGEGSLGVIAQTVARMGGGALGVIAQTVESRIAGGGLIASIGQSVQSVGGGLVCKIAQNIRAPLSTYKFKQNGGVGNIPEFDIQISIGSQVVDGGLLVGDMVITRNEGDSALCTFTLKPSFGVQDLNQWHGKTIYVYVITPTAVHRLYTGTVDIPEIDLERGRITLRCTDQRTERNNALDPVFVQSIGYWSDDLFSEPDDLNEELQNRLETIPYSFDYDAEGTGYLTAWEPKASADFIISDASIYRRTPSITTLSRGRVTNQVNLSIEFQYQRLRHREINYTFNSGLSACHYSAWGLPPTAVQLKQAAEAAGWPVANFTYEGLDPSGRYSCNGTTIYWTAVRKTGALTPSTDDNNDPVTDQNGNPTFSASSTETVNWTSVYAQTANWKASKRWAQNVVEKINLVVTAPQSIAQYGLVERDLSVGTQSEYDAEKWENYPVHKSAPSNAVLSPNGDYIIDKNSADLPAYNAAVLAAIAKARNEIVASHRDNRVTIETPFWPQLDLRHTVQTTSGKIQCKGKVSRIVHTLTLSDPACSTEIEISLSQSTGTATDSGLTLPARPAVTDPDTTSGGVWNPSNAIGLNTHTIPIGGTQNPAWNGYIFKQLANINTDNYLGLKVPVAMIVDTPAIDEQSRDTKEAETSATNTVAIRNDLLEITFNGE